jgi:serine/threonine protein kinase/WD40 repeat protein
MHTLSGTAGTDREAIISQICDEYAQSLQTGNDLSIDTYLQRFPEFAQQLRPALNSVRLLVSLGGQYVVPSSGAILGDFQIQRMVARGGMGIVYQARQTSLDRTVALKVLSRREGDSSRAAGVMRFENEIRASATLDHPNIVPIYAVQRIGRFHFYAMRWIEGMDWNTWSVSMGSGDESLRRDFRQLATAIRDIADGLQHAHSRGVIHRDIKPSNLLRDPDGNVWIVDFGLAHFPNAASLTVTGELVGTIRYMSPEQAQSGAVRVDERTDIYSLGATFFEMVTGQPPVTASTPSEQLRQVLAADFRKPRELDARVPRDLQTIILKMMAHDPADRYPSARALVDDLNRYLSDRPILASPPSWSQIILKWSRARAGALLAVMSSLAVVVLALVVLMGQLLHARRQLQDQLVVSHAAEARSRVSSRKPGQRFAALENVRKATQVTPPSSWRREWIEAMKQTAATATSLCDIQTIAEFPRPQGGSLDSVVIHPDHTIGTYYQDGQFCLMNMRTGHIQAKLAVPSEVLTVVFSPDERHLSMLCGPEDNPTISGWDWKTGSRLWQRSATSFTSSPMRFSLAMNPKKRLLAIGLNDGAVEILNHSDGTTLQRLDGLNAPIGQTRFSHAGNRIMAAAIEGKAVWCWNLDSGDRIATWELDETFSMAWSKDDSVVALGNGFDIHLHGGPNWSQHLGTLTGPHEIIANMYFHPSGRWLAVYGYDGKTRIWDCDSLTVRLEVDGHAGDFNSDGRQLAFRSYDSLGVWSFSFEDVVWHQTDPRTQLQSPGVACFLNQGRWLAHGDQSCQLWEVDTRRRIFTLEGVPIRDLCNCEQPGFLLVSTERGLYSVDHAQLEKAILQGQTVSAFPWDDLKVRKLILPESVVPGSLSASASADVVAVATQEGGVGLVLDGLHWRWLVKGGAHFHYVAVSANHRFVAASEKNNPRTVLWSLDQDKVREIESPEGGSVAFGLVGNSLQLMTSEQARYRLWEVQTEDATLNHRIDFPRPSGYQKSFVGFHADLGWFVSLDRLTCAIIDPLTHEYRIQLTDGYQVDRSLALISDPQGRRLLSANGDAGFLVWNLQRARDELKLVGLSDFLKSND